jgi:non-canonical purine NTP pyrophosphatase (RdgB/HAM1 family)
VLVEDTSLSLHALNGFPGPLIKWLFETVGNSGICKLLPQEDRTAKAEVEFAYCDENGVQIFSAEREGRIADTPRGEAGFGWDPIFIPAGHECTWAEMSDEEKHATFMRRIALEKLTAFLSLKK